MKTLILTILFLLLTACSPVIEYRYIEQTIPAPPAEPDYYILSWKRQGDLYCLDEMGTKKLRKDEALCRGNAREMRTILEGLRSKVTPSK